MIYFRRQILLIAFKVFDLVVMALSFGMAMGDHRFLFKAILNSTLSFLLFLGEPENALLFISLALTWHTIFIFFKLYHSRRLSSQWLELFEIVKATTLGTLILLLGLFVIKQDVITLSFLTIFWILTTGLTVLSRVTMRLILARMRLQGRNLRYMLIVGTNQRAIEFANRLKANKKLGFSIIGFVDDEWKGVTAIQETGLSIVADLKNFKKFIRNNIIDEVMICLPVKSFYNQTHEIVKICEEQGVKIRFRPMIFDLKFATSRTERFDGELMVTFATGDAIGWRLIPKRALDIAISFVGLLALLPVFLIVSLLIKFYTPGPVFFIQDRVGFNKRRFKLYKFRTMIQGAEQKIKELEELNEVSGPVFKIMDDPRITSIGKFLRKSSIDEFPQLFNVLKGDMSLVGPRPLPVRDYERFDQDWHRRRFSVKPGITCLWQVSGRSGIQFDQWMELDMKYIDQWTFKLDIIILLRTIPAIFKASGAT